jgi:hypothetical protein
MELNTIQDIERAIEALTPQQREQLYQWIEQRHTRRTDDRIRREASGQTVVEEMRALRARIKPDPEGWTTRDYVSYGRR